MYTEAQISYSVKNYAKIYNKTIKIIEYKQSSSRIPDGFELVKMPTQTGRTSNRPNPTSFIDSLRRTKTVISDLVQCNEFDLFITFTFAKDRQNLQKQKTKLTNWIHNQKRIHGNFEYLLVPEFHKDGQSIHFHGLFKNYKGTLSQASKNINNRPTYNIKSYQLGFTTAVEIDNHEKVSSYIKKYITKDMPQIKGKKRYWTSKGLIRTTIVQNIDLSTIPETKIQQTYTNDVLTIYEISEIIELQQLR